MDDLKLKEENFFEKIYANYFRQLCNYAFTITKDRQKAEDVVSGVFLRLWENQRYRTVSKCMKKYLFKSVYNECVDMLRHTAIHEKRKVGLENALSEFERNSYNPFSARVDEELTKKLLKIIEKLPTQSRKIYLMSRDEQLTHKEIAKKLHISIHTVHTLIKRDLKILRHELKDDIF